MRRFIAVAVVLVAAVAAGADDAKKASGRPARDEAAREYLAEWAAVERAALRMPRENAPAFRRRKQAEIVARLGKRHALTPAEYESAVRDYRGRQSKAAEFGKADAAFRAVTPGPGTLGVLDAGAFVAATRAAGDDLASAIRARDLEGVAAMVKAGRVALAAEAVPVRVIEAYDRAGRDGGGVFLRVRMLGGPGRDGEAYVMPAQVGPDPAADTPPTVQPKVGVRGRGR